jgi:hypothetical protein
MTKDAAMEHASAFSPGLSVAVDSESALIFVQISLHHCPAALCVALVDVVFQNGDSFHNVCRYDTLPDGTAAR